MNDKTPISNKLSRALIFGSLLTIGISELCLYKTKSQVIWQLIDYPKDKNNKLIWEPMPGSTSTSKPWGNDQKIKREDQKPNVWSVIDNKNKTELDEAEAVSKPLNLQPSNLGEAEAFLNNIPLRPSDYEPVLRLSPLVPTAEILSPDQWRFISGFNSSFKSNLGTGNQNYSANLDVGLNNKLLLSLFYSHSDDPLNKPLSKLNKQPANSWQSFGAAVRWQGLNRDDWKIAQEVLRRGMLVVGATTHLQT